MIWASLARKNLQVKNLALSYRRITFQHNEHSRSVLHNHLGDFRTAVGSRQQTKIASAYYKFRSVLSEHPQLQRAITRPTHDDIKDAMHIMSQSSVKEEINLVFVMFADLKTLFRQNPLQHHHAAYTRALISRGWLDQARGNIRVQDAGVEGYTAVIMGYQKAGKANIAVNVFCEALDKDLDLDHTLLTSLLGCLSGGLEHECILSLERSAERYLSKSAQRDGFIKVFWRTLGQFLQQRADVTSAHRSLGTGETANVANESVVIGDSISQIQSVTSEWNDQEQEALTAEISSQSSFDSAMRMLKRKHRSGSPLSPTSILALASLTDRSSDVRQMQHDLGVAPTHEIWSCVLRNAVKVRGFSAGLELYKESKESGLKPPPSMILILLRALAGNSVRSPDENFEKAMGLYSDLRSHFALETHAKIAGQQVSNIYSTLLGLLVDSQSMTNAFPALISILKDMTHFDVKLEQSTTTTLLISLMRSMPSPDAAYEIYCLFQLHLKTTMDANGCDAIMSTFSALSFNDKSISPPSLFFLILDDLRLRGYKSAFKAYTNLFSHIARSCNSGASKEQLTALIRDIHSRLLLDKSITVDTPLLNALMNAYNHANSPIEAMRVWETIYGSGAHNNASLSIALDTLNFAGALQQGASLMAKVYKSGFTLDNNNWQSWLELLCRAEKIDEATRLVCFDMARSDPPVTPDEDHITTLLKYAWNSGKRGEVQARLKKHWPTVWVGLPDHLKK